MCSSLSWIWSLIYFSGSSFKEWCAVLSTVIIILSRPGNHQILILQEADTETSCSHLFGDAYHKTFYSNNRLYSYTPCHLFSLWSCSGNSRFSRDRGSQGYHYNPDKSQKFNCTQTSQNWHAGRPADNRAAGSACFYFIPRRKNIILLRTTSGYWRHRCIEWDRLSGEPGWHPGNDPIRNNTGYPIENDWRKVNRTWLQFQWFSWNIWWHASHRTAEGRQPWTKTARSRQRNWHGPVRWC